MNEELLRIGAAYIRVSDERQDEYSPDSQLKKIREYASREGYLIPDEYVFYDDGISGKSTKRRDDFNRMIATAKDKTHPFEVIYVWKFSRFARNQEESMVYKNLLRKKGVTVVSVSEPIPEGHYGTLIERVIEWMDEFYLVNLGTEVTRGMTEKASRGEPVVPPPYGYVMREGKYYPDEGSGAADVVREIFRRYAAGEGQRALAVELGDRGVRTKYGNKPDKRWIDYILTNSVYTGKIRWSTDGSRSISRRHLDNDNIMEVDGHHEAIIDKDLWEAAQKVYAEQKRKYPKHARREQPIEYALKGLVRCSACGGTLAMNSVTSGKNRVRTLQCCNYNRGSCKVSHSLLLPKLEAGFLQGLEKAVGEQKFEIVPQKPKKTSSSDVDYDKLIALEERKLERAKEAYLAEIDTIEQYKRNKENIAERIAKLKETRDKVSIKEIDVDAFAKKVAGILEFIKREDVTPKAKNEALRTIIESVVFEKAKGNLAIYFRA